MPEPIAEFRLSLQRVHPRSAPNAKPQLPDWTGQRDAQGSILAVVGSLHSVVPAVIEKWVTGFSSELTVRYNSESRSARLFSGIE